MQSRMTLNCWSPPHPSTGIIHIYIYRCVPPNLVFWSDGNWKQFVHGMLPTEPCLCSPPLLRRVFLLYSGVCSSCVTSLSCTTTSRYYFPYWGLTPWLSTYCWATSLAALLQHFLNAFYVHECFVLMRNRKGHQITLQTVVSHHLGAGNWTWVLKKNSQCFSLISHLSIPL